MAGEILETTEKTTSFSKTQRIAVTPSPFGKEPQMESVFEPKGNVATDSFSITLIENN
jgi:hypothetical protein